MLFVLLVYSCASDAAQAADQPKDKANTTAAQLLESQPRKDWRGWRERNEWYATHLAPLLNPQTPQADRERLFAEEEKLAQSGDGGAQYIVGSLYRIGQPTSPLPRDLDKAHIYLSNAAIHGKVEAMAQTAEVELAAHNYQEAMNWAQIYGHYALLLPEDHRPSEGYLAGLLARINEHFDSSKLPEVVRDLNVFIANYDAQIQAAQKEWQAAPSFMSSLSRRDREASLAVMESATASDFAEYLVAFKPDGTVENAWLLDSFPDTRMGTRLRTYAIAYRVSPASSEDGPGLRYGWVPVVYDDRRYELLKSKSDKR